MPGQTNEKNSSKKDYKKNGSNHHLGKSSKI